MSGVAVQQIIKSISLTEVLVFFKSSFIASAPKSELPLFSPLRILLSLIPVLETIHSSFVSTSFSNSLLVSIYSGTYPCIPVIAALILLI